VAESIHTTYDAGSLTLDSHLDTALALPDHALSAHQDETFVREAVYGVNRYAQLISAFLRAFYHHCSGTALLCDRPRYSMLTYLAIVRMEDIGLDQFSAIVRANDAQKMLVWMEFLFNKRHLQTCLRADWLKIYDKQWVDERISACNLTAE
jgi:hypothetical protein